MFSSTEKSIIARLYTERAERLWGRSHPFLWDSLNKENISGDAREVARLSERRLLFCWWIFCLPNFELGFTRLPPAALRVHPSPPPPLFSVAPRRLFFAVSAVEMAWIHGGSVGVALRSLNEGGLEWVWDSTFAPRNYAWFAMQLAASMMADYRAVYLQFSIVCGAVSLLHNEWLRTGK